MNFSRCVRSASALGEERIVQWSNPETKETTMPRLAFIAIGALALLAACPAGAHEYRKGDLTIVHPWARPTADGASMGAAYLSIKNAGAAPDKLVSAASPVAEKVELHESREENGVMTMRPVEGGIEIAPGASQELKPGGYHIMLIGLKKRLQEDQTIPLTLTLANAGPIDVEAKVEKRAPAGATAAPMRAPDMKGMDHSMH
jgi:periplasmic copper chaperone A